jgi:hypothetical protein
MTSILSPTQLSIADLINEPNILQVKNFCDLVPQPLTLPPSLPQLQAQHRCQVICWMKESLEIDIVPHPKMWLDQEKLAIQEDATAQSRTIRTAEGATNYRVIDDFDPQVVLSSSFRNLERSLTWSELSRIQRIRMNSRKDIRNILYIYSHISCYTKFSTPEACMYVWRNDSDGGETAQGRPNRC